MKKMLKTLCILSCFFQPFQNCHVHYQEYKHIKKHKQLIVHLLSIDPKDVSFKLAQASGERETVSSIVTRNKACAGVNGGNYRREGRCNGNPVGLLKIDNRIIADPQFFRGCLGFKRNGQVLIDYCKIDWHLMINNINFPLHRINQPRGEKEVIIFNSAFGNQTKTDDHGTEIVVEKNMIQNIHINEGNTKIPENGFIISIAQDALLDYTDLHVGDQVVLTHQFQTLKNDTIIDAPEWHSMDFVLGGAGLLVKEGKIVHNFENEFSYGKPIIHCPGEIAADFHSWLERKWLIHKRHPRTAVGIKSDGTILIAVVEGRNPQRSIGMTFQELAEFMQKQGCCDALNIGGGGDSAMVYKNKLMNIPSGSSFKMDRNIERPVSEAIIIKAI